MLPLLEFNVSEKSHSGAELRRNELLDFVRAIAIALVVLRHGYQSQLAIGGGSQRWLSFFENISINGWLGVDIFFVLSGFILSRQLLNKSLPDNCWPSIREFWIRRLYRILPCYLVTIGIVWLLYEFEGDRRNATGPLELLKHVFFLQDYFRSNLLITTWSLATEAKFYLLLPFVVLASHRYSATYFTSTLIALSAIVLCSRLAYCLSLDPSTYPDFFWQVRAPFHFAVDGLLLGVSAGFISRGNPARLKVIERNRAAFILTLSFALLAMLGGTNWLEDSFALSTIAIWLVALLTAGILAIGFNPMNPPFPFVRTAIVASRLAGISYPLYLVHYPVSKIAEQFALDMEGSKSTLCLFWLVYLTASLFCAWAMHKAVEMPFLRLRGPRRNDQTATATT